MEITVWDETLGNTARYDLDNDDDVARFQSLYGYDLWRRIIYLCPGELFRIKCISRWDGD